jgi:hypothetical protein
LQTTTQVIQHAVSITTPQHAVSITTPQSHEMTANSRSQKIPSTLRIIEILPIAAACPILLMVQLHDCSSDPAAGKDKLTRYPSLDAGSRLQASGGEAANTTLLATFCKDHVPRSCDHALLTNSTRSTRPCSLAESFLSSGDTLTLELRVTESTALRCV